MRDKIIIWTPDPPTGYGAFDDWESDEEEIKNKEIEDNERKETCFDTENCVTNIN